MSIELRLTWSNHSTSWSDIIPMQFTVTRKWLHLQLGITCIFPFPNKISRHRLHVNTIFKLGHFILLILLCLNTYQVQCTGYIWHLHNILLRDSLLLCWNTSCPKCSLCVCKFVVILLNTNVLRNVPFHQLKQVFFLKLQFYKTGYQGLVIVMQELP